MDTYEIGDTIQFKLPRSANTEVFTNGIILNILSPISIEIKSGDAKFCINPKTSKIKIVSKGPK